MPRVQAIVVRDDRVLMVKHSRNGEELRYRCSGIREDFVFLGTEILRLN